MRRLTVDEMLTLGWTWLGPVEVRTEEGDHLELRIAELPDFFLAAETLPQLMEELKPALRAFLTSYLERGEDPPLPSLHWRVWVGLKQRTAAPVEVTSQTGHRLRLQVA